LLDGPLSAPDHELRLEMQRDLWSLRKQRAATFILATHDQDKALGMADSVSVLRDRAFEQTGTPGDV
jgi:iron(III) transport system ATP-binding protein